MKSWEIVKASAASRLPAVRASAASWWSAVKASVTSWWPAVKAWVRERSWAYSLTAFMAVLIPFTWITIIASGWSRAVFPLLVAPFFLALFAVLKSVVLFGSLEQKWETFASALVYAGLTLMTVFAYLIGEPAVRDKFIDALLFGQVVPLLSVAKLCVKAWYAPTPPESAEEEAERKAWVRAQRKKIQEQFRVK